MPTIAIYGGTFDPVHLGHLIVARAVAERCGFRRVTLMPSASPPHKSAALSSPTDRLEMLRLAVADDPLFEVSDLELRRSGPSYTIDTLAELGRQADPGAGIAWIIGADMLAILPKWHRAAEVVRQARIITAVRPGWDNREGTPQTATQPVVPKELERDLREAFGPDISSRLLADVVQTPRIEISSTDIRERCAAGLSIRYLVPPAVEQYIRERNLYAKSGPAA